MARIGVVHGTVTMLALAGLVSGCGSPGSTTTDTVASGESSRLTTSQWEEYETARTDLAQATAATKKKFKTCSDSADYGQAKKWQACVGDSFSELATTAGDMGATLASFDGTVSGACADALANLRNYVGTFEASAEALQKVVGTANLAAYPSASQNLTLAANAGRDEAKTFDEECRPA